MGLLKANISKIIGYRGSASLTIAASQFDTTPLATTLIFLDDNGATQSFQVGRPSFTQTFVTVRPGDCFLAQVAQDLILSDVDFIGFG